MKLISITPCAKVVVVESSEFAENKCQSSRGDVCADDSLEESCLEVLFGIDASSFWLSL